MGMPSEACALHSVGERQTWTPGPTALPEGARAARVPVRAAELLLVAALTLLAAVLRFVDAGTWNFEADEVYTLRDSLVINPRNPRPLIYLLNHYLVQPFHQLDEFGLRFLPIIFGVLAIPVLYWLVRRAAGPQAALVSALLLAVSPLHVGRSQYARYWSLVFLLATIYPMAFYFGFRERSWRWVAAGLISGILAVLAHPAASLLFGGIAVWGAIEFRRDPRFRDLLRGWAGRAALLLIVVLIGLVAARMLPILGRWLEMGQEIRLPGVALLLSYAEGLTIPLVVAGTAGIALLWRDDKPLALMLVCVFAIPAGFLTILSLVISVATTYLYATAPVFFIGAGVLVSRVGSAIGERFTRRLVTATIVGLLLVSVVPTLASQYRDGGRADYRSVALFLRSASASGNVIISDEPPVLRHYLPGVTIDTLFRDTTRLAAQLARAPRGEASWIVALTSKRGGFKTNLLGLGAISDYVYRECQLRRTVGVARLDFRQNELQVYRCPPSTGEAVTGATARSSDRVSSSR